MNHAVVRVFRPCTLQVGVALAGTQHRIVESMTSGSRAVNESIRSESDLVCALRARNEVVKVVGVRGCAPRADAPFAYLNEIDHTYDTVGNYSIHNIRNERRLELAWHPPCACSDHCRVH